MSLEDRIVSVLEAAADLSKAPDMARYMRDKFEFFGVQSGPRRQALGPFLKGRSAVCRWPTVSVVCFCRRLWAKPQRECQHAVCDILVAHQKHADALGLLDFLKELITTKSWWDTVDALSMVAGGMLDRPGTWEVVDSWIIDESFWVRRAAIICQRTRGVRTDAKRLFDYCRQCAGEEEFFISKGIGWALRSYARVDEEAVCNFVRSTTLSKLSEREALKHVAKGRKG